MELLDPKPHYKRNLYRRALLLVSAPVLCGFFFLIALNQLTATEHVRAAGYTGMLVVISLSIVCSFAFSASITKRMQTIISRAESTLAKGKINPSGSGDDEIAYDDEITYLENMICQASNKLQEAEKHRLLIAGMVAHDIASPLTAAQINLELVEENAETISSDQKKPLVFAVENVNQVIAFIRQFIQIQKFNKEAGGLPDEVANLGHKYHGSFLNTALIHMLTPVFIQVAFLIFVDNQFPTSPEHLSEILSWGIFANVIMTLGMVLSFSLSISNRLELLMTNAAKLDKSVPLKEAVGGSDELAHLDAILRKASSLLEEATEQRASRMSSMANNVRMPLNNSLALIAEFDHATENILLETIKNRLSRARRSISAVLTLLNDLFTLDAVETGTLQITKSDCNIRQVIDEAIADVASLASQKDISILNQGDEITIHADKSKLGQILINYLHNAIKFSGNGKSIEVSTQRQDKFLRVMVRDQGPGIDSETAQHVFEKFFQGANENLQGFGLGLSVCQLIAQSHGGQVGVESQVGSGSTFWLDVPC